LPEEGGEMPVTRSRARAEESPTDTLETAMQTFQTLLLEVRALREEQAQKEVLYAEELRRRDKELQRLQSQLSLSIIRAVSGDGTRVTGNYECADLGFKIKPDTFDGTTPCGSSFRNSR